MGMARLGEGVFKWACHDGLCTFSSVRQCRKTSKQGYPFTNLKIVNLMHILIALGMQPLYSRFLCHGVHQKGKNRVQKSAQRNLPRPSQRSYTLELLFFGLLSHIFYRSQVPSLSLQYLRCSVTQSLSQSCY